jgi:hypothetical protein
VSLPYVRRETKMRRNFTFLLMIIFEVLLISCSSKTGESPLATPGGSPLEGQSPVSTPLPAIVFNEPIRAGDTQVSGSGPPSLPIRLYDVGLTGDELGSGVIGKDGTFKVKLASPLRAGQRVGLALGDMTGTDFSYDALKEQAIINLPVIGLLFADVEVQP